jgi:hypothetical protein
MFAVASSSAIGLWQLAGEIRCLLNAARTLVLRYLWVGTQGPCPIHLAACAVRSDNAVGRLAFLHPTEIVVEAALSRVQNEVYNRLHAFVEERLLSVPRKNWMEAFDYSGRGSTYNRARVIQTIYDCSAPIPGPALDPHSETFLREVRLLVHEAITEGGGELVSDILGQPAHLHVA